MKPCIAGGGAVVPPLTVSANTETAKSSAVPDRKAAEYHRKCMVLWPTEYLLEELRVTDAAEAMAGFGDTNYQPHVVHNSAVELASRRKAIEDILDYRDRHGVDVPEPTYGIPRGVIEAIKQRRSIEVEIGQFTELRRSGDSCRGVCPICPGKSNPSMLATWAERDTWHCFGCNIGGDVIAFEMAMTGCDFPEAVRHLSNVTGVKLPDPRQVIKSGRI